MAGRFQQVRALEGVGVALMIVEVLRNLAPTSVAAGLILSLGIITAAARGGARPGAAGVVVGAAYYAFFQESRSSTVSTVINTTATFLIVTSVTVAVVADLRARAARRLAEERSHTEKLEALDKAKSAFLRLASHELRGPLGILNGYAELLDDGTFGAPAAADIRVAIPIMRSKIAEMQTLVDSLLEQARLEDLGGVLERHRIDMGDVVDDAVQVIRPIASANHQVKWERPREAIEIEGDHTRVQLIATGLLHNAVKFSPHGGVVQLFLSAHAGNAVLTVWDHGLGVAQRDIPVLFTRFGRIVTAENAHISGIGLGLYLARELARLHGGDIEVQTVEGRGSTFTVTLPLAAPADLPETPPQRGEAIELTATATGSSAPAAAVVDVALGKSQKAAE